MNVARGQDGKAILIQSDCGWDQGDPFAPVGFSYGLKTALLDCQALLRNLVLEATGDSQLVDQVRTWAYLDDIFFFVPPHLLKQAARMFGGQYKQTVRIFGG